MTSTYIKQKLSEVKGKIDKSTYLNTFNKNKLCIRKCQHQMVKF